ncbi:MAG: 30S ribosomal protein S13 [archaeon]
MAGKDNKKVEKSAKDTKAATKLEDKALAKEKEKPVFKGNDARTRPIPKHIDLSKEGKDFRNIIRICGKDLPGYLKLSKGLQEITGIGHRVGGIVEDVFNKKTKKVLVKIGYLTDEDIETITDIIANLDKHVPSWMLNRAKLREGGKKHLIMADLDLRKRQEVQELGKMKTYRGLRLQWGLTVRGQKTRSSFRHGTSVGVVKEKVTKK